MNNFTEIIGEFRFVLTELVCVPTYRMMTYLRGRNTMRFTLHITKEWFSAANSEEFGRKIIAEKAFHESIGRIAIAR